MPQSLSHLIVHAVFSTKDRRPFLHSEEIRIETYAYMAESNAETVTAYIPDQAQHHRKFSYQEELRELLKRPRVAFDERFLRE